MEFEERDGEPWLVLAGDVDINLVEPVSDRELSRFQTDDTLHVDLRDVTFLDSLGLGLLLRLRQVAGSVRLVEPPRDIVRLLELCGVQPLFDVERRAA